MYPGGFVYLYSFLYKITDNGADIFKAQQIFAGFYMLQLLVVLIVYCQLAEKARFPPWMMIFASISGYRVHSIFSLRMFNDGPANILAWIAVYCFMNKKWTFGSIIYSLAISIKMNNLLFLPGICVVFMRNLKIPNTIFQFLVILLVQGMSQTCNWDTRRGLRCCWIWVSVDISSRIHRKGVWVQQKIFP